MKRTEDFQIHHEVANLQEGKPFVQLLGSFKSLWNELEMYRPHTTNAAILRQRTEGIEFFSYWQVSVQILKTCEAT